MSEVEIQGEELQIVLGKNSHIEITPEKKVKRLHELDEKSFERLVSTASLASSVAFEALKAKGTNLIICNNKDNVKADIIARNDEDGLDLTWQPIEVSEQEMEEIAKKIKDKCDFIGYKAPEKKPIEISKPELIQANKNNYQLEALIRVP